MLYNFINIKEFLYKPGQFYEIPTFQRPYTWTKEDAELFIEDLENIHSHTEKEHYFGSIICDQYGSKSEIIDGQQRATTVLLMITALYHIFEDHPDRTTETYHNPSVVRNHFLYNEDSQLEKNRIKLRTVTVDNLIFEKIFKREALTPNEKSSRLNTVYQYFYDYFKNKPDSTSYIDDLKRFRVIDLTIQPGVDDDSQRIFESINSTGAKLVASDLIRNE
ncbi:MAG: DUF262 domain-containing protein [Candidatus Saccharibacteria bacterium]|nr:DUF262 domain-containing protein [Candidatus Saccharibacteria bacterium]